jgi:hypothetical protein
MREYECLFFAAERVTFLTDFLTDFLTAFFQFF